VVKRFGYWPAFHDAEVTSITLDRTGASRVEIEFEGVCGVSAELACEDLRVSIKPIL
jgi:hypothetical protein